MFNFYGFCVIVNSYLEFLWENVEKDVLIFIVFNFGDIFWLVEFVKLVKNYYIDFIVFVGEKKFKIG